MIVAKVLKRGLTPISRRRAAVALGLALAAVLRRVGRFDVKVCAWRGTPDVAHIRGEKVGVELGRHVDVEVVDYVVENFRRRKWDGVTVELSGELGGVKLGVDVDVYASEYVPLRAGVTNRGVDVLAEPRGYVGERVVESFYELFDVEREGMEALIEELAAEMCNVGIKTAAKARQLWKLVTEVYALRDYSFAPDDAMPLWYRPWIRQMARYLYGLAPPGLRELAGPHGMRRVVEGAAPELLKYLARHYKVRPHEDALQLIPLSARAHRDVVTDLKSVLTQAMKTVASTRAQRIISEKGHLDWDEYIKALEEELRQRFRAPP